MRSIILGNPVLEPKHLFNDRKYKQSPKSQKKNSPLYSLKMELLCQYSQYNMESTSCFIHRLKNSLTSRFRDFLHLVINRKVICLLGDMQHVVAFLRAIISQNLPPFLMCRVANIKNILLTTSFV